MAAQNAEAVDRCGDVCDETWSDTVEPYSLTCPVTVPSGCALTIDSGVTVISADSYLHLPASGGVLTAAGVTFEDTDPATEDRILWIKGGTVSISISVFEGAVYLDSEVGQNVSITGSDFTALESSLRASGSGVDFSGIAGNSWAPDSFTRLFGLGFGMTSTNIGG